MVLNQIYLSQGCVAIYLAITFAISIGYTLQTRKTKVHILNPRKPFEMTLSRSKAEFVHGARKMLRDWFDKQPNTPAYVNADWGRVMVLPPHMANEIANDKRFSFSKFVEVAFHSKLPGFESMRAMSTDTSGGLINEVIRKDLTQQLAGITKILADEATLSVQALLSNAKEWHEIPLRQTMSHFIARTSSRVFLGKQLCRNDKWIRVTDEYAVAIFRATEQLRMWPRISRPIINWCLPTCYHLRALTKEAHRIMQPVLDERRALKADAKARGQQPPEFNDAIDWFERAAEGVRYDPATIQLFLSLTAIHTTTDLLCQVLTDIAQHPDIIEPLRKEIRAVLCGQGLDNSSLNRMRLLDSVIKESQRLKPIEMATMRSFALQDVILSDGTPIQKGDGVVVSCHAMWDPALHSNPLEWDGYRFYRMRDMPGRKQLAQVNVTDPQHLGFSHGQYACPGRFFAVNEVRVALVEILLNYDFELRTGASPRLREFGFAMASDPLLKIRVRRIANANSTEGALGHDGELHSQ